MLARLAATAGLGLVMAAAAAAPASAQNLVGCAGENGFCRVPYPTTVVYGFRGATTSRFVQGGGIPCNNGSFGDPAPNRVKQCWFMARGYGGERRGGYERRDRYYEPPPPPPQRYYYPPPRY